MKAILIVMMIVATAQAQTMRVDLIPKYFSYALDHGTGNYPLFYALDDSQSNWIEYDGVSDGAVIDSVPVGEGPFDSLIIDCRTDWNVYVRILYSNWNRGILYPVLDTFGPLSWHHAIALRDSIDRFWPSERNPGFIALWIPMARADGSQNEINRVYWGRMYLVRNDASVSYASTPDVPMRAVWCDILGRVVNMGGNLPRGVYFSNDGRKVLR